MKKLLGIVVLGLLWCGNAYADKYFLKSIDNLNSNLETANSFDVIFYVSEVSQALIEPKTSALKCYRDLNNDSQNLYSDNCKRFRNIFKNNNNQFRLTFKQLNNIFENLIAKQLGGFFNDVRPTRYEKYMDDIANIEEFIQLTVKILRMGLRFK